MYVFLLILGAVITAAGVVLVAASMPIPGHDFDATIITPGAVAIVGGLILIGLGLAVRGLSRIERVLAARAALQPARPQTAEAPSPLTSGPAAAPAPLPSLAAVPLTEPRINPADAPAAVDHDAATEDAALNRSGERFPALVRTDRLVEVEAAGAPARQAAAVRADGGMHETAELPAAKQAVGGLPGRTVTRFDRGGRVASRADRRRSFDAFWPKRQTAQTTRSDELPHDIDGGGPQSRVEPVLPIAPESTDAAPLGEQAQQMEDAGDRDVAVASVLKSGVVDGMAYTLYSDGSIEAQLPQGTLRFGSIAELRHHIEQSA